MWTIILALCVALAAGSQGLQYELEFPSNKIFTYAYEGQVVTGLPQDVFAKSGIKVKCRAQIGTNAPRILFLKIHDIEVLEFNGIQKTDTFTSSPNFTNLLEKDLAVPISFDYTRGQVGELYIPKGLSKTTVNLLRGILNILQLTIKKTQNAYIMQENGISGLCQTSYVIQEKPKANQLLITKSVNLNNCEENERMVTGNAYFYTCPLCKQRNNNFRAAATYSYNVKGTNTGGRLLGAEVQEVHQFTPFNEIDGAVVVEARQRLVLATVQEQIHSTPENNDYITKESLRYHFERKLIQTPIQLLRTKNAENQIPTLLQHLVEHDMGPLSKASPGKFMQLVQHLRRASLEEIEGLWKRFSGRLHYRRWILDAIPAIGNHFSLRFLKLKLKELSEFEAAQAVPLALHLIKADREAIAEAKALLEAVNAHCGSLVRKVGYLAYGSLVHKFCSQTHYCTEETLQPLHNLLAEANEAVDMMDIILALKGLGNSGQATSIKKILKFLPRIITTVSNLPLPVQVAAALALKKIAIKNPVKILDICQELYMDIQQHPVIRSIAASIILDNKPSPAIVMMIAKSLMKEADMEVGSFVYSLMKKFSRSVNPELHEVAAICNMAVEMLKSRFEATRSRFSSGLFSDIYSDSLKSGLQGIFNILPKAADAFPVAAIGRLKMHFMGVFTELLEIGYHAEGLQELLMNRHLFSSGSGLNNIKKIMDMLKKLHDWKPLPWDEPLVFAHFKMFGQELFYQELNKHSIENILKFFSSGKSALLHATVKALQTGLDIHWSKPLLSSENLLIVPTCVGLPLETSLYYSSVTRVKLQAQSHITPDPKDDLRILQLLESNINLKAKIFLSMTKDIVFMIGVNTNLIQAGLEHRTQVSLVLPANVDVNLNIGQKHFKMDFIPELPDNEVFAIRSKAFAVTRNSEDLAAAKMTPIVAAGTEPNILKQTVSPKGLSAGDASRAKGKFSDEVLSKENAYWSEQPRRRPQLSDVSVCAKAGDLGFQVCFIKNSLTAAFVRSCPLYHIIGDHSVKVLFKPVHTGASVEKIQIEFQAGPGATMKMVRSVNVRGADGGIQELENPIDRMALSKLQKILGTSEITQKVGSRNSSSSNESSSNSGNTSQFSIASESSMRSNASTASQEKQRLQNGTKNREQQQESHRHSEQETQHQIYPHHPGKHKGRDKKKEMEIHCKCWPENTDHHNPSHERWEKEHYQKGQHTTKGHYSKEQHETPHKDQYESWENGHHQHKHREGERDRQHKREHEGGNKGEHKKQKHKQGEPKEHHTGHHEGAQEHQDKDQHTKRGPDREQKGHQRKSQHETYHKDQYESGENDKYHKNQHTKGEPDSQHKGPHSKWQHVTNHKGENERWENGNQHKHHEDEGDRQHKREHEGGNQGEHEKQKHKQGEPKEHHTGHHEGAQEHQDKDQHTKGGPDSHKKGQHSKHGIQHKDQYESRENGHHQHKHREGERDRQHKREHEGGNKGEHEKQKHKQGESKEHHTGHHEGAQEHQNKDQHTKGGPDSHKKGQHSKHEIQHKDQYESGENSHQHKHREGERNKQHKGEHERRNQGKHQIHKPELGEAKQHHEGQHKGVQQHQDKYQHTKGEADSQNKAPHETHHKGEHERQENGNQQKHHEGETDKRHKGEHEKENQQHKQGEAKEHYKGHDEGVQRHHHKDQHKGYQKETQIPNSKEPKRNCTCWQKPKESGTHHKEEQKDRHHRTKCHHSQGKASNKKCKFLSSESSSSSGDSSLSEGKHERKSTKWHKIQQQYSDSNSLSLGKQSGNRRHRKGSKKRHSLGHQKQHKESKKHAKEFRRHLKDSSITFPNTGLNDTRTPMSQKEIYSISQISSNLLELFEVESINSKFESTSTLMHGRVTKSSSSSSSSYYYPSSYKHGRFTKSSSSSSYYNPSSYKYGRFTKTSSSSSYYYPSSYKYSGRFSPDFVLFVKAFMSGSQQKGYQTTAHLERSHAQVEIVSLDQRSSWKTCFDASVSGFHKASAAIKWGTNCQDYIIAAKLSTGQMAGDPAVQLSWKWKRLPSWINGLTKSVMPFVPGVAYTLGFSELRRQNAPHQVTVRVASTSTDTINTSLRTPEMTIYKQGIPFPCDLSFATHWLKNIHLTDVTALPDVTSLVKRTSEAVCKVDTEKILTFDGMNLGCSLSPAHCYTVIAQDCSNQLRFLVAMKKTGQGFSTFELNVKLRSSDIKIHCDISEEFHVQLNGMWLLLTNDTYINERECIRIHKNATSVTVKAPENGVEQISFNGHSVLIQISPLMRGQTCGLCGDADHNQQNDWKKPNREKAKSCNGLVHSWTAPEDTCQSGCAMTRQYVMLEDQFIDERQSTCYSVEPVLTCVKGCHPTAMTTFPVAFHCLPKDAAIGLADWQASPRDSSEDLIKDIDVPTGCACTEECSAAQQ
ncbi:vitellogenin-1-like isoform X2 [Aquarana catesbeiana]|uniref:vitellogenin-1-like isoform X2 n=1 Tax=Aquarana catesbeiana TaxID=8400 RepID=UPI003CCA3997